MASIFAQIRKHFACQVLIVYSNPYRVKTDPVIKFDPELRVKATLVTADIKLCMVPSMYSNPGELMLDPVCHPLIPRYRLMNVVPA